MDEGMRKLLAHVDGSIGQVRDSGDNDMNAPVIGNIMIVGEYVLLRESLVRLIKREIGENTVQLLEADSIALAFPVIENIEQLDLLILCYLKDSEERYEAMARVRQRYPELAVVMPDKGGFDGNLLPLSPVGRDCISITPSYDQVLDAVRGVMMNKVSDSDLFMKNDLDVVGVKTTQDNTSGGNTKNGSCYRLTASQYKVLRLIQLGNSNKDIARLLRVTEGTVKVHCMAIYRELGVTNRTQAAMLTKGMFFQAASRSLDSLW